MKFTHIVFAFFLVNDPRCVSVAAAPFFLLNNNICLTNHWQSLGSEVYNSLNTSVNPCENFYNFACDGWISKNRKPPSEIAWNHFRIAGARVNRRLRAILLEEDGATSASLRKAQIAYRACTAEKNFVGPLRLLLEAFGGWSLSSSTSSKRRKHDWLIDVIKATRITESYPVVKMHVAVDMQNTSRHVLYIEPGQTNLPRAILMHPTAYAAILSKYKRWILHSVKHLYPERHLAELEGKVEEVIEFEIRLAKLSSLQNRRRKITMKQLSSTTGINWKRMTDLLFAGTTVRLTNNEESVLYSPNYMQSLLFLLKTTQSKDVLTNYIIWSIIRNLSRDTSSYMRSLSSEMDEAVFGTQSDVPRSNECVSKVSEHLGSALAAKYAEKYLNPGAIRQAKSMAEDIKVEYVAVLTENKWLSPAARKLATEKILAAEFLVGFPSWMANATRVDDFNREAIVSNNHFLNVLNSKRLSVKRGLGKFNEPTSKVWWPINPFESNGFYYVLHNTIIIPLGILEPPFFDGGRPAVFNYAALGSLIGHELSHALDTIGRQADKDGNIKQWWPEEDVSAYELKAECFTGEHSSYAVGENIADNVGVLLSYRALKKRKEEKSHVALPHLNSYTYEQLFFIAYSQLWCEVPDVVGYKNVLGEEHPPVHERVMGTLNNSREFRKSFACLSSKEVNYCELW